MVGFISMINIAFYDLSNVIDKKTVPICIDTVVDNWKSICEIIRQITSKIKTICEVIRCFCRKSTVFYKKMK